MSCVCLHNYMTNDLSAMIIKCNICKYIIVGCITLTLRIENVELRPAT